MTRIKLKNLFLFFCIREPDIEHFLKNKAVLFEKLGNSRTFLIFNDDEDEFKILAYYTLGLQVLKVPEELLSGSKTKYLDGFSSKRKGKIITEFPTILIGQLGKNDLYEDYITGSEVMHYCLATLLRGQARYEGFGFQKIEKDYEEDELLEMIKILQEEEIIEKKKHH